MRFNGRTWPYWVLGAATIWFIAIVAFWAVQPLTDHVATTVAHVPTAQEVADAQANGTTPPTRVAGPTVAVECRSPASSSARDLAAEQALLVGLLDNARRPLTGAEFTRVPCAQAHRQARLLWF